MKGKSRFSSKKYVASILVFVLLAMLAGGLAFLEARIERQTRQVAATQGFAVFQDHVHTFLIGKANILRGFTAYVQTFDDFAEDEVYEYLDYLLGEEDVYIRNVGIIKGTVIQWNYPREENAGAIGKDLLQVPEQAAVVERIRETMQYSFDGPTKLIQGGTGYTMRVPIEKDGAYWGMISIVLRADKVKELFDSYAEECGLRTAILDLRRGGTLVYGDTGVVGQADSTFRSAFTGADWEVHVLVDDRSGTGSRSLVPFFLLAGLLLAVVGTVVTFRFFRSAEELGSRNETLSLAAMHDKLTGIHNRGYLDARIAEEIDRLRRHDGSLCMVIFDLDHFKRVNDTFGHASGDDVLRETAATVRQNLRGGDVLARWGGEEFAILMPDTTLQGAAVAAEKLRSLLEKTEHGTVGIVTASFGVAQYAKGEYAGSFFRRADEALYKSKSGGRNRVTLDEREAGDADVLILVEWQKEWACGSRPIDEEHKALVRQGNELVEHAYQSGDKAQTLERAKSFSLYSAMHFRNEEAILKRIGYPGLEAHIGEHQRLEEQTEEMIRRLTAGEIGPLELFRFFRDNVVTHHIVEEDGKYFGMFQKRSE